MIRRESFCDGRLVKEIDQINVSGPDRSEYIDGRWRWLLDNEEVPEGEAEAFRTTWQAKHPMVDLVRWLRVQLDEDERTARAATWHDDAGTWTAHQSEYDSPRRSERRWFIIDSMDDGVITDVDPEASQPDGVARHVAEHDPARVLREIDAKRQLLDLHGLVHRDLLWIDETSEERTAEIPVCGHCVPRHSSFSHPSAVPQGPCTTLRLLALPYADRPGYKESWRP